MAAENPVAFAAYPAASRRRWRWLRPAGASYRHPRRRIQFDRPQYTPGLAVLRRLRSPTPARAGRSRLLLDSDVPFVPQYAKRADAMKWIQIDIDPLKADFPMWGFPTDMRIQGDCAVVLQQVLDVVEARADDAYRRRVGERIAGWNGAREASAKRRAAASAKQGRGGRAQPGLPAGDFERKALAGRRRPQRGDPQRTRAAGARHALRSHRPMSGSPAAALDSAAAWRWG